MNDKWTPYRPDRNWDKVPYWDLESEIWDHGGPWAGVSGYLKRRKAKYVGWLVVLVAISVFILVFGITVGFLDQSFWKDFTSNGVATLVGAVIGIPIAFYIERRINKRSDKERKKAILEAIITALIGNSEQITRLLEALEENNLLMTTLDDSVIEATYMVRYDVISNLDLNLELDGLRSSIARVQKLMDLHDRMLITNIGKKTSKVFRTYKENLLSETTALRDKIGKALAHVKAEYDHTVESIRLTDPEERQNVGKPI